MYCVSVTCIIFCVNLSNSGLGLIANCFPTNSMNGRYNRNLNLILLLFFDLLIIMNGTIKKSIAIGQIPVCLLAMPSVTFIHFLFFSICDISIENLHFIYISIIEISSNPSFHCQDKGYFITGICDDGCQFDRYIDRSALMPRV